MRKARRLRDGVASADLRDTYCLRLCALTQPGGTDWKIVLTMDRDVVETARLSRHVAILNVLVGQKSTGHGLATMVRLASFVRLIEELLASRQESAACMHELACHRKRC